MKILEFGFGAVWFLGVGAGLASAKEETIPLEKAPAKAVSAVKAKWPKAEILGVKSGEVKRTLYEFFLKEAEKKWEAAFTDEGKLVMVEEPVPESDTPAAVKSAAFKRYPNAKIVGFAKEIQGDGADAKVLFELKLKELERKWEASFSPEGKWVEEEESLKKTDLPSSVKQGLQKERPKAKILEVLKKTTAAGDSSHAVYHVDIKNGRSKESLSFNESGSLLYNKAKEDEKEAAKGTNNPERKSREAPAKETKEGTAR